MSSNSAHSIKYRPEIDGLRAVAVIAVILFHAKFPLFRGGYIGVDIFFVISGFVITISILKDLDSNRFRLSDFYERRARRILPALIVTSVITVIAGWILMNPIELAKLGEALIGVATFSSNVIFYKSHGYFDVANDTNPLIHTWSLSVEEQWYLIFPFLFLALWRFSRERIFLLLCILTVTSFAMSEWGWRNHPVASFFIVVTRAWELLSGSIAAFVAYRKSPKESEIFALIGVLLIFAPIFFYDEFMPSPSFYTLVPVGGAILILLFSGPSTLVGQWLSAKLAIQIGLISYSAYLLHQPIIAFSKLYKNEVGLTLTHSTIVFVLNLSLAYLLWKYIEFPIRQGKIFKKKELFFVGLTCLATLGIIGFLSKKVAGPPIELAIAEKLSKVEFVYFSNLDERIFTEARLSLPIRRPEVVIMGSSRVLQISSKTIGESSLNLGVSGASVEDYVAFVGEAVAKLRPRDVYLGADPWLFNVNDEQDAWQSSTALYKKWERRMVTGEFSEPPTNSDVTNEINGSRHKYNFVRSLYFLVSNGRSIVAKNGDVETIPKKAYDGFLIYDSNYSTKPNEIIRKSFDNDIDYGMKNFEFDKAAYYKYRLLIDWLKMNGVKPHIVLTPMHPELYERFKNKRPIILDSESQFRKIGDDLRVEVIGSYDPNKTKCYASDFYDGLHPRETCMARIMRNRGK